MKLQRFHTITHLDAMNSILIARNHKECDGATIPQIGYVVLKEDVMIAGAFVRKVEGGFGQLDGLFSNPEIPYEERSEAQDTAVRACLNHAKDIGITQLLAFCKIAAPIERSFSHGFKLLPHAVIVVDLNDKG